MNRLRPVAGKAGQTTATGPSSASSSASAPGPMFPAGVESNVEQYVKRNCLQPWRFSQSGASSLRETASYAPTERVLRDGKGVAVGKVVSIVVVHGGPGHIKKKPNSHQHNTT